MVGPRQDRGHGRLDPDRRSGRAPPAFAAAVRATDRTSHGLTAIGAAMLAAAAAFDHMPEPAAHRVIDVSGDGMANFGPPPAQVRDELVAQGITINGLAILTEEPWLADYYKQQRDRRGVELLPGRREHGQLRRGDAQEAGAGGRRRGAANDAERDGLSHQRGSLASDGRVGPAKRAA